LKKEEIILMKNAAKIQKRRLARNRWHIYRNQSRSYLGSNFRSKGTAEAFLRSLKLDPENFDLIKERVTA